MTMKLYVFEHCPYCIRAMMMPKLKKLDVETVVIQNHDVDARLEKVGANVVPILQKSDGTYMAESLDIVRYLDQHDGDPVLEESTNDQQISDWHSSVADSARVLLYPRFLMLDLPEFTTAEAKVWFTKNKSATIDMDFDTAFNKTADHLPAVNAALSTIDWLTPPSARGGRLGYDDILCFPTLRNLTAVKGTVFPKPARRYIEEISQLTGVTLFDSIAV